MALALLSLADGGHEEDLRERLFAAVGTQSLSPAAPSEVPLEERSMPTPAESRGSDRQQLAGLTRPIAGYRPHTR